MTFERYYIQNIEGSSINQKMDYIQKKMSAKGHVLIETSTKCDGDETIEYEIDGIGIKFYVEKRDSNEFTGGNVRLIGKPEDIIKTRLQIEKETGFIFKELESDWD